MLEGATNSFDIPSCPPLTYPFLPLMYFF